MRLTSIIEAGADLTWGWHGGLSTDDTHLSYYRYGSYPMTIGIGRTRMRRVTVWIYGVMSLHEILIKAYAVIESESGYVPDIDVFRREIHEIDMVYELWNKSPEDIWVAIGDPKIEWHTSIKEAKLLESRIFCHSQVTPKFKKLFNKLPDRVQGEAKELFGRWRNDNSVGDFGTLTKNKKYWRIEVGPRWRAVGMEIENKGGRAIVWTFIGSHEDYNSYVRQL